MFLEKKRLNILLKCGNCLFVCLFVCFAHVFFLLLWLLRKQTILFSNFIISVLVASSSSSPSTCLNTGIDLETTPRLIADLISFPLIYCCCFSYEFNVYQDDEDLTDYFILMTVDFFEECNVRLVQQPTEQGCLFINLFID